MYQKTLSFQMPEKDHTDLKICCAKLGITLKDFIINALIEKIKIHEDKISKSEKEKFGKSPVPDCYTHFSQ